MPDLDEKKKRAMEREEEEARYDGFRKIRWIIYRVEIWSDSWVGLTLNFAVPPSAWFYLG